MLLNFTTWNSLEKATRTSKIPIRINRTYIRILVRTFDFIWRTDWSPNTHNCVTDDENSWLPIEPWKFDNPHNREFAIFAATLPKKRIADSNDPMDNEDRVEQGQHENGSGDGSTLMSGPDRVESRDANVGEAANPMQVPSTMSLGTLQPQQQPHQQIPIAANPDLLQQLSLAQQQLALQPQNVANQLNYSDFLSAINSAVNLNLMLQRDQQQPSISSVNGSQLSEGSDSRSGMNDRDNFSLLRQDRQTIQSPSFLAQAQPLSRARTSQVQNWSRRSVTTTTASSSIEDTGSQDSSSRTAVTAAPRPSRLPCRARGMSEDHDFNVSGVPAVIGEISSGASIL